MKVYRIYEHGGVDKLTFEDAASPHPGKGQVKLRHVAIGLNYSDVQARTGGSIYAGASLPLTPGIEAIGEVVAVGEGVRRFREGDVAGYGDLLGAYAEERVVPQENLVTIPRGVTP